MCYTIKNWFNKIAPKILGAIDNNELRNVKYSQSNKV